MKHIFLTGASSGIGRATAALLASKGHRVFAASRNISTIESLREQWADQIIPVQVDVRDYAAVSEAIRSAASEQGLDVLINNAGLGYFDPVAEGRIEDWHEMVDTNVKGVLNCIHAALPSLRAKHGQIINVGSVASHLVFPNSGIYCATKHAVLAISESLRLELSQSIRVTTISPGSVNTPFIQKTHNQKLLSEYLPGFESGLTPENIASHIAYAIDAPEDTVISEIIVRPGKIPKGY